VGAGDGTREIDDEQIRKLTLLGKFRAGHELRISAARNTADHIAALMKGGDYVRQRSNSL
jgi:hypothetical protein